MAEKMSWLVKRYNNTKKNTDGEKMEYIVKDTKETMGTIVIPTGGGKSGHIYSDIIQNIENSKGNQKIIFNISAPILKLEAQLLVDFFDTIKHIFSDKINQFILMLNSSDTTDKYEDIVKGLSDLNIVRFNKENLDFFFNSNARFAIVASCHRSLQKFIDKIDYIGDKAIAISYIDEGHLLNNDNVGHERTKNEIVKMSSIKEFCKSCNKYGHKFYAFTATPDQEITETINEFTGKDKDNYIYQITPIELIKNNIILPPMWQYKYLPEGYKFDSDNYDSYAKLLYNFMQEVKKENSEIKHKILVNCSRATEVEMISKILTNMGCQVFSTTSKYGAKFRCKMNDNNEVIEEEDYFESEINELNFVNAVDTCNKDCFVIHIKQLIQGIDIKSLTDTVICTSSVLDSATSKKVVQIIGRVLRPLNGERGKDISERKKKYGNVLFVIPEEFKCLDNYEKLLHNYYGGVGDMKFIIPNRTNPYKKNDDIVISNDDDIWDSFKRNCKIELDYDFEKMLFNIKEYIEKNLVKKYRLWKRFPNINVEKAIEDDIKDITQKFGGIDSLYDSVQILYRNSGQLEYAIKQLFKQYGI